MVVGVNPTEMVAINFKLELFSANFAVKMSARRGHRGMSNGKDYFFQIETRNHDSWIVHDESFRFLRSKFNTE